MLKTIGLLDVSELEVGNGNGKVVGFGNGSNSEELAKKSGKSKG